MENLENKPIIPPQVGILIGILAVSTASIFIKYAQQDGVASIVIAAYRLGIAALILGPVVLLRYRDDIGKLTKNDLQLSLLSGFFLAVHFAAWIKSLEFTSVTSSVVLVTTTPLWVAIFSPFTIKEKISKIILVGMALALAGTLVIGFSDVCDLDAKAICPPLSTWLNVRVFIGDFLALVGAWAAAGYVLIGRRLRTEFSLIPYIFVVYGMAAILLLVLMVMSGAQYVGFDSGVYIWLILLALIPQLIGHSTFNWALGFLPATYVAVTLLGEPIGSTVLAYIFLGETPGLVKIIGAILIFVGILTASKPEKPAV